MKAEKQTSGTTIPFTLEFEAGSIPEITGFDVFDSVKLEAWTANYPINELPITLNSTTITGELSSEMTEKMFGYVEMKLTCKAGEKNYVNKFNTEIYIAL